jgi:hypothetical protein
MDTPCLVVKNEPSHKAFRKHLHTNCGHGET